tara:strand:+ start:4343 stop:6445 length:2103 start_codon:yes stop_codon:yes gene_type:complete
LRQVVQYFSKTSPEVIDVPYPSENDNKIIIRTSLSLISSGTEKMLVEFSKSNFLKKALNQPDKVKQALEKSKTDGFLSTYQSIKNKLDDPIQLGYSNVGVVVFVGKNIKGFSLGDRVLSNGPHSEYISISPHLCCLIPQEVSDENAVFTVLASIGLQGIRLANPTLGETFLVSGLGLIGILTSQLLIANGIKVLGIDPDPNRTKLASSLGIETFTLKSNSDPVSWAQNKTDNVGVDGVLITAATSSNNPIEIAAKSCRKRGRIILVGVTGLNLNRDLFYKKEILFQVSCSYGPGRYDSNYEENNQDYPIGFVRWTEERNFQAIIHLLKQKLIQPSIFITHRFSIKKATDAYKLLLEGDSYLGILLTYQTKKNTSQILKLYNKSLLKSFDKNKVISFIGSGNYAKKILIPSFSKSGASFHTIVSKSGLGPTQIGKKFGFSFSSTDLNSILKNKKSGAVVIATRHDSHAKLIIDCLKAKKHVFVEKPLCLTRKELLNIKEVYTGENILMVGFNRRFSPFVKEIKKYLKNESGPKSFVYMCNSGYIPYEHWTQSTSIGGGRLIGEACHFVDLIRFLADSPIDKIKLFESPNKKIPSDIFSLQTIFKDGSIGTIHYFANGNKSYPKERLEVFFSGKIVSLDNFRKLKTWGLPRYSFGKSFKQDKGQDNCVKAFLDAISNQKESPIQFSELIEVQEKIFEALENK